MTSYLESPFTGGQQIHPGRAESPWLAYRIARWSVLSARLLVVWWPLAPIWITALAAGPLALLPTVVTVVGLWSPWWRRQLRTSVERSYTLGWRALWPRICALAGLAVPLARRARVPELVAVERGPGLVPAWTTLQVRPLGAHDPDVWYDRIADRVRRVTKHAAVLSWQHNDGTLVIRLFRHPLPDHLPVDLDQIARLKDHVVLGRSIENDSIRWAVDLRPHAVVVGVTGGGKGILLRLILAHAVCCGWAISILNPKRSGEYGWLRNRASIAKTLPGMAAMVADVFDEMQMRQDLIEAAGVDTWHELPELTTRRLLVLDESASLIGVGNKDQHAQTRREIAGQLAAIVAMGRSAGIHVVLLTQHPVAESFGPSGSTMKTNTGARIVVGSSPPEGLRMMFGPDLGPSVSKALSAGRPGRCLYQGLDPSKGARITAGQIYYAHQTDLHTLTGPNIEAGLVRDFDTEALALIAGEGDGERGRS